MRYKECLDELYKRQGIKLGLGNINELLSRMGKPDKAYKTVHIAGTNGKGSVAMFICSILRRSGYRVGLYTSPHLVDFTERIQVDAKPMPRTDVIRLYSQIKPFLKDHTFFEIVTAMAFSYFDEQGVDYAVVEVGMGGRLDATNAVMPVLSVITNISVEHEQYLGSSVEDIAKEKAGIIKKGVPVVTGATGKALERIRAIAEERDARLYAPEKRSYRLRMLGAFQQENAQVAAEACRILGCSSDVIEKGLSEAFWPGRMQLLEGCLLFDCAHNPAGAKALADELLMLGKSKATLVVGMMDDKDKEGICRELSRVATEVVCCMPKQERSARPENVAKLFLGKKVRIIEDVAEALSYAREKDTTGLVVLTGSIFAVAEGFSALSLEPFDPQIDKRRIQRCKEHLE